MILEADNNKKFHFDKKKLLSKEVIALAVLLCVTIALIVFLTLMKENVNSTPVTTKSETYYEYFDTVCSVYDYSGGDDALFEENCRMIEVSLSYYHRLFDIYHEYDGMNNIATLNRLAGKEAVKVDRALIDFLSYAVSMHELTDGNVNIAMGSVLSIWHEYREKGTGVPSIEELTEANAHTDIKGLIIDGEACTVKFADPALRLDVGAIAKGYAAEMCAELLTSCGLTSYVLDLGGNLRTIGTKADGSAWRTGVQNPDIYSDVPYVYYLNISNTSVVTSGDYQRYYYANGVRYHHIINKDTLFPADRFASVTVVTENSGLADALSTALFNMSKDAALELLDTIDDISVVWVYHDGAIETYGLD